MTALSKKKRVVHAWWIILYIINCCNIAYNTVCHRISTCLQYFPAMFLNLYNGSSWYGFCVLRFTLLFYNIWKLIFRIKYVMYTILYVPIVMANYNVSYETLLFVYVSFLSSLVVVRNFTQWLMVRPIHGYDYFSTWFRFIHF